MRDDELLHRFLLGELAEDEAEDLERRLLQEDALFDLCEAIEGDLLAASVRGDLTPEENERVLARLAASPHGRARLAVARDLVRAAEEVPAEPIPAPLPFLRRIPGAPPRPAARWAALAAGLFLVAGGSWVAITRLPETEPLGGDVNIAYGSRQPTTSIEGREQPPSLPAPQETPAPPPAPSQPATAPAAPPAPAPEPPRITEPEPRLATAVLQLAFATRRDFGPAAAPLQLKVPEDTRNIEIQLDLGGAEQDPAYNSFNALVRSSGASEVWRQEGLKPQSMDWGKGLTLTGLVLDIPAVQLPEGKYEVEVQGVNAEAAAETLGVQEFEIVAE